jgi:indole-3-glycerol phosphate synthase
MNALDPILASTRDAVARRRETTPLAALEPRDTPLRPFVDTLKRPGIQVIAEHKRRSPSAGAIREDLSLEDVVAAYERGGAAALSVLTEGPSFGGSLEDLHRAANASALPILRKDFTVDEYQLHESFSAGADAILLIVAALAPDELARLYAQARALGLAALVEVHDERELEAALALEPQVIGINNRDLTTLRVELETTFALAPRIPAGTAVVAESGFRSRGELERLAGAGIDAVLIGEALMRSPDLEAAVRELTI